jgi:CspA family cold shock protein
MGTVKWFDPKKGFGFILNEAGKDVFVHFSNITGQGYRVLREGETVEYEPVDNQKGLSANNVRVVETPDKAPTRANADAAPIAIASPHS